VLVDMQQSVSICNYSRAKMCIAA